MRKQVLALAMVLAMLMGVAAQATGPMKIPRATPSISFNSNGTQATCTINVYGSNDSAKLNATMTLWRGSTRLNAWSAQGTGQLRITKKVAVISGHTYKLTVDYTINGVKQPQQSTTRTCP